MPKALDASIQELDRLLKQLRIENKVPGRILDDALHFFKEAPLEGKEERIPLIEHIMKIADNHGKPLDESLKVSEEILVYLASARRQSRLVKYAGFASIGALLLAIVINFIETIQVFNSLAISLLLVSILVSLAGFSLQTVAQHAIKMRMEKLRELMDNVHQLSEELIQAQNKMQNFGVDR